MVQTILEAWKLGVQADITRAVKNPETVICTKYHEYVARQKGSLWVVTVHTAKPSVFEARAVEGAGTK